MTIKSKILLAVSLTAFAVSLTGVLWGLFLPIGAIIFSQFMIFTVLGKETALYDEEQRSRFALAEANALSPRPGPLAQREVSFRGAHALTSV